ncbi:hypothetical protein NH340_JMT02171 [Sarcoptes scabiei]|nr:hypothetical protein NH340_JMT02171 [Sarcoptes scabiei]
MDQTRISRDEEIPRYTPSTPNRIGKERAEQSKPSTMNMNKLIEQHQSSNQHRWMHSRRKRIGQNRIGSDKYRHLQDVCCLILICSDHNRIALIEQNHEQKGLFLPNFRFKQTNHSIKQIVRNFLQKIFIYDNRVRFDDSQLTVERIRIPNRIKNDDGQYIFRYTYRIVVGASIPFYRKKTSTRALPSISTSTSAMRCVCQTTQLSMIYWLSYQDVCLKLSSYLLSSRVSTTTTPTSPKTKPTTTRFDTSKLLNVDYLLGPEPKLFLEQYFLQQRQQYRKSRRNNSNNKTLDKIPIEENAIDVREEEDGGEEERFIGSQSPKFSSSQSPPALITTTTTTTTSTIRKRTKPIMSPLVWKEIFLDENDHWIRQLIQQLNNEESFNNLIAVEKQRQQQQQHSISVGGFVRDRNELSTILDCRRLMMTDDRLHSLSNEFLLQCYPSNFMTYQNFRLFWMKISQNKINQQSIRPSSSSSSSSSLWMDETRIWKYFRAWDRNGLSYLCFDELLCGVLLFGTQFRCTRPRLCNGQCNENKLDYLFRFYSVDHKSLSHDDLIQIATDWFRSHRLTIDQHNDDGVEKLNLIKKKLSLLPPEMITWEKFRSNSIEAKNSFVWIGLEVNLEQFFDTVLAIPMDFDALILPSMMKNDHFSQRWQNLYQNPSNSIECERCKNRSFRISSPFITVADIGEISEVNPIDSIQIEAMKFRIEIKETSIHIMANDLINKINRIGSITFDAYDDQNSLNNPNESDSIVNWFYPTKSKLLEHLNLIIAEVRNIFRKESRVLDIESPCFVLGDLHGNLEDLLHFSRVLWKSSPFINQARYLFLGDYVDRGPYGVECLVYLFCMKILAPNHFLLLRGNHEIREIQEQFSFYEECCDRFSLKLWEQINSALDYMPISAMIDGRLFCAHGGIPISINTIEQIRQIPERILQPLLESNETWEILWNDPINDKELANILMIENGTWRLRNFLPNSRRGTAFLYTDRATKIFCEKNQIDFILRAHEVYDQGFRFHHHGIVLTVFSCSKYSNLNNQASVLFVSGEKIRIIQIQSDDE